MRESDWSSDVCSSDLQNIFPDKKYEDKLNRVKNYNTTIRNIKSEAEQRSKPSVFSKENSFTQLSFKDIFTAYNNVIENKPSFYPDYGTERYINSADTDLMMLVFVLMLTVIVCCRDKMTGMAAVIRQTPKGRIHSAGEQLEYAVPGAYRTERNTGQGDGGEVHRGGGAVRAYPERFGD